MLFGGDFNEIKSMSERTVCLIITRGMIMTSVKVLDLPLVGRRFTWTNFQESDKNIAGWTGFLYLSRGLTSSNVINGGFLDLFQIIAPFY